MAYVPPHLRKSNPHQIKSNNDVKLKLDTTETNFPTLVHSPLPKISPKGNKFVEITDNWRDIDNRTKNEENFKKNAMSNNQNFVLPRFVPSRKYEESTVESVSPQKAEQNDEWTEIVRKKRAPKQEKTFEEMEKEMQEKDEEETVWNKQEEESCWDDRY